MPLVLRLLLVCGIASLGLGCIAVAGPQEDCPCTSSLAPQTPTTLAGLPTPECG